MRETVAIVRDFLTYKNDKMADLQFFFKFTLFLHARKEFFREILYNNIAIIAIQYSKINFVTFGDFSHTIE